MSAITATRAKIESLYALLSTHECIAVSGPSRDVLLDALLSHKARLQPGTPASQWKPVKDQRALIFVVHMNAQFATDAADLAQWQGWFVGYWTDFNTGGWVWNGLSGVVTHVMECPGLPAGRGFEQVRG